jgi:4-amino-4-deoxy-L-arabinose transferase-like glycosyltransferase
MKLITASITSIKSNKLLTMILIVAAALRFIGTNPGYDQFHSDEGISYSQGIAIILERTLDAHGYALSYNYPTIVPLSNALADVLFFIPGSFLIYFLHHPRTFVFDIFHWSEVTKQLNLILWTEVFGDRMVNVLHWGRYVTAVYSLGAVFLTYKISKLVFNRNVALLAAFFVTFNFRQVLNSHIGLPDIYNCFFFLLSLLFSLILLKKPTTKNYILAGLFAALSFSTKFQLFAFLGLGLSYLYILLQDNKKNFFKKLLDKKIFLSILVLIIVPIILNPYHILHWQITYDQLKSVSLKYSFGKNQLSLYPYSYLYHFGIGEFLSIFSILGLFVLFKRNLKMAFWFFSQIAIIFYIFTYLSNGGFYTRNFIPITPVLLIFSAYFLYEVFLFLETKISYRVFLVVSAATILTSVAIPARDSIIDSYYYSKEWGYTTILSKNESILPDNIVIASHPFNPVSKIHPYKRIDFEFATSYSFAEFKEQGAGYAYVNMDLASNAFYGWMSQSLPTSLKYWNKPVSMLNNTFYALSINEMMQYIIVDTYKPWQAPDAALFIAKIPELEKDVSYHSLSSYHFDQGLEGWIVQNPEDVNNQPVYQYSSQGIVRKPGSSLDEIVRISSPELTVKPGYSYMISGYMKSDQEIDQDKRNSFIRADFSPGMSVGVSARYWGIGWKKYSFEVLAPKGVNTLRISFQNAASSTTPVWLDNVTVEESDNPVVISDSFPVPFNVYRDLLYTNSHGNL